MFACLLLCCMSMFTYLDLGFAMPPWACACRSLGPLACVVTFVPSRACLDVTICEIQLYGVGVLDSQLSPLCVMLICLPCLLSFGLFFFFASLHACLVVYAWVYMLSIFQSHGTMHTQSKPTFVLLGHPIFCLITCLLAPVWHLLLASLLACFPSICFFAHPIQTYICPPRAPHFLFHYMFTCPVWHLLLACLLACFPSICFFACLLTCFFCHCMYTHGEWTLGARV